jgi:serine protease inhibitor ecotin
MDIKEKQMVFSTKLVNESIEKINDGIVLKRYQNPWLKSEVGVRRQGVIFRMTSDEQEEYIRCALDIYHFTEKYCKVKTEDGTINNITFDGRDYQKQMLDSFVQNRFSILMASRQVGKTISASIFMIHTILFSNDKNIMIVANKSDTTVEIVDKIKSIYSLLPFFLKPGVRVWNQKSITFDNGCRIKTSARTKTPAIGHAIDILYLDEFAHIPSNIIEPYYQAAFPTISAITDSKIIITSTPNGMNLFHKLLTDAERPPGDPQKNNYKAMRVYWHQVPGRFVTYIRLNDHRMWEHGVTKEQIFNLVNDVWSSVTKVEMKWIVDLQKYVIYVHNNEFCTEEQVKTMTFVNKDNFDTPIAAIAELTTWKEEAIKDIGSEEAFNQEYGLRFINSSRSLLDESIVDDLLKNKKNYIFEQIPEFDQKLRFSYADLKWIDDDNVFVPIKRKDYKIVVAVDISEGLGQDYSVINIFKISEKPRELIEIQKLAYKSLVDFFRLEQIGIYRNNFISVKQLSELLYMICFVYFNPENVKIVLEINNYGNTLLAEMPHVFDGNNEYGSSIFFRYKHRVDSSEEKIGLKVGDNKNLLVKDYQELMRSRGFIITNEDNIREVTTFVKHITSAGNIKYAADGGEHDDTVMTIVDATSVFTRNDFREMVDEYAQKFVNKDHMNYINECLKNTEYVEGVDYSQVLRVRRQHINRNKDNTVIGNNTKIVDWFGTNRRI